MTALSTISQGKVIIYGAGGLGREVLQLLRSIGGCGILGFVDDGIAPGIVRNDVTVLGNIGYLDTLREPFSLIFGMASPSAKQKIHATLRTNPLISFPVVIHPSAEVSPFASLGSGTLVSSSCIVAPDAVIGECVSLNWGTTVGHDAVIESYSSIMPKVSVAGNVKIGGRTLIGVQSAIYQGITIGSDATVGMGSIVLRDVPDNATVLGNPARRVS